MSHAAPSPEPRPVDLSQWVLLPRHLTPPMRQAMAQVNEAESYEQAFQGVVDAALHDMEAPEDPSKWAVVPRDITLEMWKAWEASLVLQEDEGESFNALLSAAPTPPLGLRERLMVLAQGKPTPPSSRVLVERGFLGVKHFDTEQEHAHWKALPWWRRLFS